MASRESIKRVITRDCIHNIDQYTKFNSMNYISSEISCEQFDTPDETVSIPFISLCFLQRTFQEIMTSKGNTFKALSDINKRSNTSSHSRKTQSSENMSPFKVAKNIWKQLAKPKNVELQSNKIM